VRICIIGKFPPIQGGVSRHTYWTAHALAQRGHEVHVVTNAKEVEFPYRMHMGAADWRRCEARYGAGAVKVHWTEPADASQFHIPMSSPFVSKLAAIAAQVHGRHRFDVVYSHYLEPYGVAGFLVSQMTGVPHVARMAGSDAGRLWHHPQLETLYDHVLRSADQVIAIGAVAQRAAERGVDADRIVPGGGFAVPEHLFRPRGRVLDIDALRGEVAATPGARELMWGGFAANRPYFGICGKLGESKGSFALLDALCRLKREGLNVGLVALAHGPLSVEQAFRARARRLGLFDHVLQLPFLPHWRIPEFLRGCLAACCLEQNFPIEFHSPIIPREVLLCGTCLVASTEVLRKLPAYGRLPDRYGCVAIEDVNDIDLLSRRLGEIVRTPARAAIVGKRGHAYAHEIQHDLSFPDRVEAILQASAAGAGRAVPARASAAEIEHSAHPERFPLTRIAAAAIGALAQCTAPAARDPIDAAAASRVLEEIELRIARGEPRLQTLAAAVGAEVAIAAAEREAIDASPRGDPDPLFRLQSCDWAVADIAQLIVVRDPRIRLLEFDVDVAELLGARSTAELPARPAARRSYVVAFRGSGAGRDDPLVVDELTAHILRLSDGTRTARAVARELDREKAGSRANDNLKWIERLFLHGLIRLSEPGVREAPAGSSRIASGRRIRAVNRRSSSRGGTGRFPARRQGVK
jgi:glycosyltransferase involved in cell wall biosynthesis